MRSPGAFFFFFFSLCPRVITSGGMWDCSIPVPSPVCQLWDAWVTTCWQNKIIKGELWDYLLERKCIVTLFWSIQRYRPRPAVFQISDGRCRPLKLRFLGPTHRVSNSTGVGWGPWICISNKLRVMLTGQMQTMLRGVLGENRHKGFQLPELSDQQEDSFPHPPLFFLFWKY